MSFSPYTTKSEEEIFKELDVSRKGLHSDQVAKRLIIYGPNLIRAKEIHWWEIFLRQFKSSFVLLLLAASLLTFFLQEPIDGIMIILFVLINAFLGFYQEHRSEEALKSLKQYIASKVKVVREGATIVVNTSEVVQGDILIVAPGDIIPADLRFIETVDLMIDESILTGESAPVRKRDNKLDSGTEQIYKAVNIGFAGTTVLRGEGKGVVFATGSSTVKGEIARLSVETKHISSFEKGIDGFSTFILRLTLVTLMLVFITNFSIKQGNVDLVKLAIFSIALAVSVIPEALPIITTFSLSRGALRLAKHKVVVKRLSSIEDLGSIEVLCTDKTGTLTENTLRVDEIHADNRQKALIYGALAAPILKKENLKQIDPFDVAFVDALSTEEKKTLGSYKKISEIPFDPERKRSSVLVQKDNTNILIVRGAPEAIIKLCRNIDDKKKDNVAQWITHKGSEGFRLIAVAACKINRHIEKLQEKDEHNVEFLGLISFTDPIKHTAQEAIHLAERLGVKIKILTGDSREVAGFVAVKLGLISKGNAVLTGDEFSNLSVDTQHKVVEEFSVFARVTPVEKYTIIKLLQEHHEVGFLGEGINDAPALKIANVGLVVQSASDVAREVSDIVLLQKSLNVVVDGIKEGREVFANTTKYIKATLSSNFGNFYALSIASLFITFLPMLPLQILLVNLLTDFPMIAVSTDAVDEKEIQRPKNYDVKEIAILATLLGLVSTVFDFIFFAIFYKLPPSVLQTNWFIGSILTELVFLYSVRSRFFAFRAKKPSMVLFWLTIVASIAAIMLPLSRFGQDVFKFVAPLSSHLFVIFSIVCVYFVVTEGVKLLYYRRVSA